MLRKIKADITERMSAYTDSRQPTGDEVAIAWLVTEVERRKTELLKQIGAFVYPTSQIVHGQITTDEYVIGIAKHFANEVFDRRMEIESLPLLAELAVILHKLKEIEY